MFSSSIIATKPFITSTRLCGGIFVAIPTAIPSEPLINSVGTADGNTDGSLSVSSKFSVQLTVSLSRSLSISLVSLVILKVELQAEKNATLAVHIHQYGNCSDADGKSAGGHWNPTEENHGAWGDGSFHSGDLGNVTTDKNGKGSLEVLDVFGRWSLDEDKTTTVLNKAIIVHAGMDDMTSQPSGAAGKRIGCGEIKNIK